MSTQPPNPQLGFWALVAQPYQGRTLLPFALSIPILCGFIVYTWKIQTPLGYLHWLPETIAAVLLLGNMVYAMVLFCRAFWFTLKAMNTHISIIATAVKDVRSDRKSNQRKRLKITDPKALRMLIPIGLIFSHVFIMCLLCLASSLLMNAPYIS